MPAATPIEPADAAFVEFQAFPKLPRYNREIIITEKIDGTNAAVGITEDGYVYAQSRKKLIYPGKQDNAGFAGWVEQNKDNLRETLGPGLHFGEWYGSGIQRGYGLTNGAKLFALFNVSRWTVGDIIPNDDDENAFFPYPWAPKAELAQVPNLTVAPVLGVAPSLKHHEFIEKVFLDLKRTGSQVTEARGFERPEGIVIWHTHGNVGFKWTFEKDEGGKEHGA